MRIVAASVLSLAAALMLAPLAFAKCGDAPGDAAAVAAARAQVATDCDCAGATNHGDYVSCAAAVATLRASNGQLPPQCRSAVRRCAARSTCGKPDAVTCCRTKPNGTTKCTVKRRASSCTAPSGGQMCIGSATSCCDACGSGGCTVTTTTTSTTTTSLATPCGDTAPSCNGNCGAGFVCWRDEFPGFGCQCLPEGVTPCIGSAYPSCGGTCPGGGICQATDVDAGSSSFALCACVTPGSACVPGAPSGTCPGACPVSHSCGLDVNFPNECICRVSEPCSGSSGYPMCNGSCDAGSTCAPFRFGPFNECVCVPTATPCDATCGGGVCPAGSACTYQLSGGVPTCFCGPP